MINYGGNMMHVDQFRKVETYSPKSSPRGGRSPIVSRQDSSGTLKTTISLGKNPSIVHSGPFYLMKEPPGESELTGATNLMAYYGLEHSYSKFSGKKVKEQLSSFLPNLPGDIDGPGDNDSSLRSVIEKPPIGGKELLQLTKNQLDAFRLHPGPLPESFRLNNTTPVVRKHKNKKHRHRDSSVPVPEQTDVTTEPHERKHKKQKRHEDDSMKSERKKRKKEKKKKKQRHTPEPTTATVTNASLIGGNNSSNLGGGNNSSMMMTGGGPMPSQMPMMPHF